MHIIVIIKIVIVLVVLMNLLCHSFCSRLLLKVGKNWFISKVYPASVFCFFLLSLNVLSRFYHNPGLHCGCLYFMQVKHQCIFIFLPQPSSTVEFIPQQDERSDLSRLVHLASLQIIFSHKPVIIMSG